MNVRTIEKPAVEPITLTEAKTQLRVDHDAEDGLILGKIEGARGHLEDLYGLALITRTLAATMAKFPTAESGLIRLPRPPATEIVSITYYDTDGAQQTLDAADYEFDPYSAPARLRPTVGTSWPETQDRFSAVEIQWKAGYGDDPTDVPPKIREAVKLALGDLYENRETIVLGLNVNTTDAIDAILCSERIHEGNLIP